MYQLILDYLHGKGDIGEIPSELADHFDMSPQNMNYYLKLLKKEDYIECYVKSTVSFYRIKKPGSGFLLQTKKNSSETPEKVFSHAEKSVPHYDNLHNIHMVVPIIKQGDLAWEPTEKQMKNWTKKYFVLEPYRVEKHGHSISVRFRLDGEKNPWESTVKAYKSVFFLCKLIEDTYGFVFGLPKLVREPHYTIKGDPIAKDQDKPVYVPGVGHMDKSVDEGELEYYSPKTTELYIRQPLSIEQIREQQRVVIDVMNQLTLAIDDVRLNTPRYDVSIQKAIERLNNTIKDKREK